MKKGAQHLLDIIEALKKDHVIGRDYVSKIQEFGVRYRSGENVVSELIHNSKGYISLLREHIIKEDEGLFPEMDRVFTEKEQKDLVRWFEEVELSGDGSSKYLNLVKELKNIVKSN
jgi:hemerythrin-like domain-containing protein